MGVVFRELSGYSKTLIERLLVQRAGAVPSRSQEDADDR